MSERSLASVLPDDTRHDAQLNELSSPVELMTTNGPLREVLSLLVIDPQLGGIVLEGGSGGLGRQMGRLLHCYMQDLSTLAASTPSKGARPVPFVDAGPPLAPSLIEGDLDWETTLRTGVKTFHSGLWEQAQGGILLIQRAEELSAAEAARLAQAFDTSPGNPLIIVDVATPPSSENTDVSHTMTSSRDCHLGALQSRLAFRVAIQGKAGAGVRLQVLQHQFAFSPASRTATAPLPDPGALIRARQLLPRVATPSPLVRWICEEATRLGVTSNALELLAWRAARARAALHDRASILADDVQCAIRWVIAPRSPSAPDAPLSADETDTRSSTTPNPPSQHPIADKSAAGVSEQNRQAGGPYHRRSGDASPSRAASHRKTGESAGRGQTPQRLLPSEILPSEIWEAGNNPRNTAPTGSSVSGSRVDPSRGKGGQHAPEYVDQPRATQGSELIGGHVPSELAPLVAAATEVRTGDLTRIMQGLSSPASPVRRRRPSAPPFRRPKQAGRPNRAAPINRQRALSSPGGSGVSSPGVYAQRASVPGVRLAVGPTLAAALPHQPFRPQRPGLAFQVKGEDLRWHTPHPRSGTLFIVVVDVSGSMGMARARAAKGLALSLLRRAYIQRDDVAVIRCSGRRPSLLLPPSRSTSAARHALDRLVVGGGTPLADSLVLSQRLADRYRERHPERQVVVALLTDGRANVPRGGWETPADGGGPGAAPVGNPLPFDPIHLQNELALLGRSLQAAGVAMAVLDRDTTGSPAENARELAQLLGTHFIAL